MPDLSTKSLKSITLGVNAKRLLKEAFTSNFGVCCTTLVGGHGHGGGRVSGGHRESDAACKLRDLGLLEFVKHDESLDTSNGWTTRHTSATWKITDRGRDMAKILWPALAAEKQLIVAGCQRLKREDRFGETKTGWWQDDVWLAPCNDPIAALRNLNGGSL